MIELIPNETPGNAEKHQRQSNWQKYPPTIEQIATRTDDPVLSKV